MIELEKIKNFIIQGFSRADIIQELNISGSDFDSFLANEGTSFSVLKDSLKKEAFLRQIEEGKTQKEIINNSSNSTSIKIDKGFANKINSEEKKQAKQRFEKNLINNLAQFEQRLTLDEAAKKLNIDESRLRSIAYKYKIKFNRKRKEEALDRAQEYIKLKNEGWTLQKIGDRDGITRERVRQVIRRGNGKIGELKSLKEIRKQQDEKRFQEIFDKYFNEYKKLYNLFKSNIYIKNKLNLQHKDIKALKKRGLENNLLSAYRPRPNSPNTHDKTELFREIIEYREQGLSITKIAIELGVSGPTVSNYIYEMKQQGMYVPSGSTEGWREQNTAVIEARIEYIIKRTKEGKKIKEIAEELGIGAGTLSRFMGKHKVHEKI